MHLLNERGEMKLHLVMIVKDESPVLMRCLESVLPIIDGWTIVDTGSTDNTIELLRQFNSQVPGHIRERPWVNFAHNKTEAIRLAESSAEGHLLFMDADDVLDIPKDFELPVLSDDAYNITVIHGIIRHQRPHIFRSNHGFKYASAVHEYLTSDQPFTTGFLPGLVYRCIGGGNRGVDPALKFQRDAKMLEEALLEQPDEPRTVFYLAQSYRDLAGELPAGDPRAAEATANALANYKKRAGLVGYYEEGFISLMEVARIQERLQYPEPMVMQAYLEAFDRMPSRGAEPLTCLARFLRLKNKFLMAYNFAKTAMEIPAPVSGLFIEQSKYDWEAADEAAVSAHYLGKFEESMAINTKLLEDGKVPAWQEARILANINFSLEARLTQLAG